MRDDFEHKLQIYYRCERAMLDVFLRNLLRQLIWATLGMLGLLGAVVFLDMAAFSALMLYWPFKITACILAGIHVALLVFCMLCMRYKKHRKTIEALESIRAVARDEVLKEFKGIRRVVQGARCMFSGDMLAQCLSILEGLLKRKSGGRKS